MRKFDSLEKTLMQEEKGTTEDEMAGWHHRLDGREFQWTPGVGDGQGGLECLDSWGHKEWDTTEQLILSDIGAERIWGDYEWVSIAFKCDTPRPDLEEWWS